jgi:uncharacterized protein YutE (UPF0331/DUF86 family)
VDRGVVAARLSTVDELLAMVRALPLDDDVAIRADPRNLATIESCLRRALEALFDVGRHILAKGFGQGVVEYRRIAESLGEMGVLEPDDVRLFGLMAGYRNRLVHLYHDVGEDELIVIARDRLADLERISAAYRVWAADHPDRLSPHL